MQKSDTSIKVSKYQFSYRLRRSGRSVYYVDTFTSGIVNIYVIHTYATTTNNFKTWASIYKVFSNCSCTSH